MLSYKDRYYQIGNIDSVKLNYMIFQEVVRNGFKNPEHMAHGS